MTSGLDLLLFYHLNYEAAQEQIIGDSKVAICGNANDNATVDIVKQS